MDSRDVVPADVGVANAAQGVMATVRTPQEPPAARRMNGSQAPGRSMAPWYPLATGPPVGRGVPSPVGCMMWTYPDLVDS